MRKTNPYRASQATINRPAIADAALSVLSDRAAAGQGPISTGALAERCGVAARVMHEALSADSRFALVRAAILGRAAHAWWPRGVNNPTPAGPSRDPASASWDRGRIVSLADRIVSVLRERATLARRVSVSVGFVRDRLGRTEADIIAAADADDRVTVDRVRCAPITMISLAEPGKDAA